MTRPLNERNAPLATWEDTFKEFTRIQGLGTKASAAEISWLADATQSIVAFGHSDFDRFAGTLQTALPGLDARKLLDSLDSLPGSDSIGDTLRSVSSRSESSVSNTERTGTTVKYVDLPTPEKFLDDFSDAYGIHLSGLVQTGAIRPEVAAFARSSGQMQAAFSNYLRERVGRLLKGEPLWKVVGTEADNKLIGARTGQQGDQRDVGTETTRGTSTQGSTTAGGAAPAADYVPFDPNNPASGPVADGGGGAPGADFSESLSYTEKSDTDRTLKTREKEALVSRNQLDVVANLSPLDFLKDAATAQSLNLVYAGEKGTAQRAGDTAKGGESFATRRI